MELLVGLGECYGAEKMIPVASAHVMPNVSAVGKGGALFIRDLADKGAQFVVTTHTNPLGTDIWSWQYYRTPEDFVQLQMTVNDSLGRMGALLCNTCTPYLVGHVPRKGEHVSWNESSAIIFANSVFGARTNREGGPNAIAAGLTGRVPEFGYHLDENRHGQLKIVVTAQLKGVHDYGALGYFTGKLAQDRVPVFVGITPSVTWDELKQLGSACAVSGSVTLFHAVGVTPEAPTEEAAFGGKKAKDSQTTEFGEKDLRESKEQLSRAKVKEVDIVSLGCPHASITELRGIARLISGKKIKPGVELWVATPRVVKTYAEILGYVEIIEASGGKVICSACPHTLSAGFVQNLGPRVIATNSAKNSLSCTAEGQDVSPHFGSVERCIDAAVSGVWR
jgi:predicted aconitase